jgi:peptide/nickel transport system ATP-binding protein
VLVLNKGSLVESGEIDRIFSAPEHPYTRALLAASDLSATDERGRLFTVDTAASYVPPALREAPSQAPPAPLPAAEGSAAEPALITVTNLGRTYHRARTTAFGPRPVVNALADVSFTVAPGQRVGIVGESGSGKSTLLRILAGLDQPTTGQATVAGTPIAGAREADLVSLRSALQIVFQDPLGSLDPRMRVADIIAEPLLVPGRKLDSAGRLAEVHRMLSLVGLEAESAHRYPHQFSGGQRQRISIARALVNRPRILVADEPVSALDVSVRAQVLNLIADLVDEYALTLLLVSHDLSVVRHLCERVIVMKDGRIVESGDTEQIYNNPAHPYTVQLIASSLDLSEELATPH